MNLFEMLFEQHPFGLAFVTPDRRFSRVNRAFCDLTGYTAPELAKLTFDDITHPDDVGPDFQLAARLFAGEIPSYDLPKRYLHKSGHPVAVELTAAAFRDPQGTIVAAIATVRPVPAGPAASATGSAELDRLRQAVLG